MVGIPTNTDFRNKTYFLVGIIFCGYLKLKTGLPTIYELYYLSFLHVII